MNKVQTYIQPETEDLITDNEALTAWEQKVMELGLSGQLKVQSGEGKSPIPFLYMKQNLVDVFSTLCPVKVNVKNYNKTPIPIEVLDLISLSVNEDYFADIQVWYDDKSPDPAVIGLSGAWWVDNQNGGRMVDFGPFRTKQKCEECIASNSLIGHKAYEYSYLRDHYLIARWGDVDRGFNDLTNMAIERFKETRKGELEQQIRFANRALEDLDQEAINKYK